MKISYPLKKIWPCLLVCLLLALAMPPAPATAAPPATEPPPPPETPFAPGELLVGLAAGSDARSDQLARLQRLAGASGAQVLNNPADEPALVRLQVAPGQEMATIAKLAGAPGVAYAEPNYLVWGAGTSAAGPAATVGEPLRPNDPLYPFSQWGSLRVDASRAWQFGTGTSVQVAVVDTGVDFGHPEFSGRLLPGKNYVPAKPIECPQAQQSAQDDAGHGTHVTGIIAAALNNGVGIAGLAPNVIIDPRKALDCRRVGTTADVSQAIRDAADSGAQIINLSLWTTSPAATLEAAINYAAGKGILLVAAAGNRAPDEPVGWPAAYPATIAVAATDRQDRWASYSNSGPEITLAAPGGTATDLLVSTWPTGLFCTTQNPVGYCTASGTSVSAAFVTGGLALLWGNRPDLSPAELRALLVETVRKTGESAEKVGAGRLDLRTAMRRALESNLELEKSRLGFLLPEKSAAFNQTLGLSNPSRDHLFWQASVNRDSAWLSVQPSQASGARASGNVRYGQPGQLTLTIAPALLAPGTYQETVTVQARRANGSQIIAQIPVNLTVADSLQNSHLPFVDSGQNGPAWLLPGEGGRELLRLTDNSSIGLLLPFTYTVAGQSFATVRLYADGFLTFPAAESVAPLPLACLPDDTPAQAALYGWWADLAPGTGGQVSRFVATDGAYVIEFADVPSGGQGAGYTVSFQMALYPDGAARLLYRSVPPEPAGVVIGMEMWDSLLYAELVCRTDSWRVGTLPQSGQSVTIRPEDLR